MADSCFPRGEIAFVIGASAFGVFLSTAFSGYIFQGDPLDQLGEEIVWRNTTKDDLIFLPGFFGNLTICHIF